ncbi:MAG TPA: type II toxin-antitoxin system HicB family antitoxin [Candidatus Tumulicola sp.]|nr:type II toxin-antitoxin system HicB family antitoxin [Candidatus Tumulicola sp.]
MDRSYAVVLEKDGADGGFCVFVPALPEVATQGETESEALENAVDAITEAVRYRRERNMDVPQSDSAEVRQVAIHAA